MIAALTVLILYVPGPATLVLKGFDPIELGRGHEIAGRTEFSSVYLRHEYHFASAENLAQFVKDPVRHAVQNGGACGKMGALTGKGSPDRWAVANGKVFLFASDGCRTTFLANKERYFAPRALAPKASAGDRKTAESLFHRMLKAHGGQALKDVKQVEWTYETPYQADGRQKIWKSWFALLGKDRFALWEEADTVRAFFVADKDRAIEGKPGEVYGIHPDERRELTAMFARNAIGILTGAAGSPLKPLEDRPGFVMSRDDIVVNVILDPTSFRLTQIEFTDHSSGPVAKVVIEYSTFESVDGVLLPKTRRIRVDDGEWSKPRTVASIKINGGPPSVFTDAMGR